MHRAVMRASCRHGCKKRSVAKVRQAAAPLMRAAPHILVSTEAPEPKAAVTSAFVSQVSDKETASQSADSPVTDVAVSSSRNGPLTSGTSE